MGAPCRVRSADADTARATVPHALMSPARRCRARFGVFRHRPAGESVHVRPARTAPKDSRRPLCRDRRAPVAGDGPFAAGGDGRAPAPSPDGGTPSRAFSPVGEGRGRRANGSLPRAVGQNRAGGAWHTVVGAVPPRAPRTLGAGSRAFGRREVNSGAGWRGRLAPAGPLPPGLGASDPGGLGYWRGGEDTAPNRPAGGAGHRGPAGTAWSDGFDLSFRCRESGLRRPGRRLAPSDGGDPPRSVATRRGGDSGDHSGGTPGHHIRGPRTDPDPAGVTGHDHSARLREPPRRPAESHQQMPSLCARRERAQ